MSDNVPSNSDGLAAFSMVLLRSEDRYLMLQRSAEKRFAPGRWTGLGGRVELGEFDDLPGAALRELHEETGIEPSSVRHFTLRRALIQSRPGHPLTVLLYFTGEIEDQGPPSGPEGQLHWLTADEIDSVDVVENTAMVIPLLIEDVQRDPAGDEPVVTGAAAFDDDGRLLRVSWSNV